MKIEITNKQLIIAAIATALIAITAIIGYNVGFGKGYDKAVAKYENPKGDGSHFFMECFDDEQKGSTSNSADLLLYHSTLDCPNIHHGTERDGYGYYKTYSKRKVPYIFCPKCMDNDLIDICERRIISAYPDDVKN